MARRAATSALLGSAVEYYDFTLYATASALFLGKIFFAPLGDAGGTLASFVTFGLAFLARPLGAITFGHFGDRLGRRNALVGAVTVMGVATLAIGLLPGYATIGPAAPIVLMVLRLLQGFSAGAEQAGSNALAMEHAPDGRRAQYASWTMQGTALGTLFGKLAFIAVVSMPSDVLLAWGWRVPFLAAGPLLVVALWIRSRVEDAAVFERTRQSGGSRVPLVDVLRHHPAQVLLVAGGSLLMTGGAALNVFGLNVATRMAGVPERSFLVLLAVVTGLELAVQPLWARLADRIGRRPIVAGTLLVEAGLFFVYLPALLSGDLLLIGVVAIAMMLAWSGANAVSASFFAEQFPTRVRYTGTAVGSQLGMIVVGFSPTIMIGLMGKGGVTWPAAAGFAAGCMLVAGMCALAARETYLVSLPELDG